MSTKRTQGAIGDRPGQQGWRTIVVGIGLLGAGMFAGELLPSAGTAWGQGQSPPVEHFQSGGQLSVPILKDIANTLHQMDARLERLEAVAKQLQKSSRTKQTRDLTVGE